jgi:hypothetical protein
MSKVLNKHAVGIPADAVYIGRGSKWGNPFKIGSTAIAPRSSPGMKHGCAISTTWASGSIRAKIYGNGGGGVIEPV